MESVIEIMDSSNDECLLLSTYTLQNTHRACGLLKRCFGQICPHGCYNMF